MKKMKKLYAWLLTLVMMVSVFAISGMAAAAEDETGSIHITKYAIDTQEEYDALSNRATGAEITDDSLEGKTPISGVDFRLTKVVAEEGMTANTAKMDTSFTPVEKETDAAGKCSFINLPEGVYLLEEFEGDTSEPNVEIKTMMDPVLISIPLTIEGAGAGETETLWEVYVYPKNLVDAEAPKIEKDVIKLDNNDAGVDKGAPFKWIITAAIPADMANSKEYRIKDSLDSRLDYVGDVGYVPTVTAEGVDLEVDTDYTVSYDASQHVLTIDFTKSGREKLATTTSNPKEVKVEFYTKLNDTAELGTSIPNQAELYYTNSQEEEFKTNSDIPKVHTGGLVILKVDGETKKPLEGAEFGLYRTEDEAIKKDPSKALQIATSDTNGIVTFDKGFAFGELGDTLAEAETKYYVAELKAPVLNGVPYNLLPEPKEVVINATSHTFSAEAPVTIENDKNPFELPFTGGVGTVVFTAGGIALLFAAFVLIKTGRKKES